MDIWKKSKFQNYNSLRKSDMETGYATNLQNFVSNEFNSEYPASYINNYYTNYENGNDLEKKLIVRSYKNFDLDVLDKFKKKREANNYRTINIEIKPKENNSPEESKQDSRKTAADKKTDLETESLIKLSQSRSIIRKTPAYLYPSNQNKNETNLNESQKDFEVEIDPDDPCAFFQFKNNFSNKISKFLLNKNEKNNFKKTSHFLPNNMEKKNEKENSQTENYEIKERCIETIEEFHSDNLESNTRGGIVLFKRKLKLTPKLGLDLYEKFNREMMMLSITLNKIEDSVKSIQKAWAIYKSNKIFSTNKIQSVWRAYKLRKKFSPILYYYYILQNQITLFQNLFDKKQKKIAFSKIFFLDEFEMYSHTLDKLRCRVLLKRSFKKFLPLKKLKKPLIDKISSYITKENKVNLRVYKFKKIESDENKCMFSKTNEINSNILKVDKIQKLWRKSFRKNKITHPHEYEILKIKKEKIFEKKLIKPLLLTKEMKSKILKIPKLKVSTSNYFTKTHTEKHYELNIKKIQNQWNTIAPVLKIKFERRHYIRKFKINSDHCYITKTENNHCSITKKIIKIQKLIKEKLLNGYHSKRRLLLPTDITEIEKLKKKFKSMIMLTAILTKKYSKESYYTLRKNQLDDKVTNIL